MITFGKILILVVESHQLSRMVETEIIYNKCFRKFELQYANLTLDEFGNLFFDPLRHLAYLVCNICTYS